MFSSTSARGIVELPWRRADGLSAAPCCMAAVLRVTISAMSGIAVLPLHRLLVFPVHQRHRCAVVKDNHTYNVFTFHSTRALCVVTLLSCEETVLSLRLPGVAAEHAAVPAGQPVRRHAHATRCRTWPTGCSLPNVA